jgi:hypothetical protein
MPPPIRGIVGHQRFDTSKILETDVTLTVRELFDIAPIVRRQIANDMKSSQPRKRNTQQARTEPVSAVSKEESLEPRVLHRVLQQEEIPQCLYITAWINGRSLPRTLVDSGAVVDLISPRAVEKIGARPRPIAEKPWGIRLASDDLVEIKECVDIAVNIEGVKMLVTAYITGNGVTYDLLLSRRWLEGVGAKEDFLNRTFSIDRKGFQLLVKPTSSKILKREPVEEETDEESDVELDTLEEMERRLADKEIEELVEELNEGKD